MRNRMASIEELNCNRTSRRDDIIRGYVKTQSRYIKRAQTQEAIGLHRTYFERVGMTA